MKSASRGPSSRERQRFLLCDSDWRRYGLRAPSIRRGEDSLADRGLGARREDGIELRARCLLGTSRQPGILKSNPWPSGSPTNCRTSTNACRRGRSSNPLTSTRASARPSMISCATGQHDILLADRLCSLARNIQRRRWIPDNTSTARLKRISAPRIKLDGRPSLERSWRTALALCPSGELNDSPQSSPLRAFASLDVAAV